MKKFIKLIIGTSLLTSFLTTTIFAATITRFDFVNNVVKEIGINSGTTTKSGYSDISIKQADIINVAFSNKIANGYSSKSFGPNDTITFEQAVTMVVRAKKLDSNKVLSTSEINNLLGNKNSYLSDWAKSYVAIALNANIISIDQIPTNNVLSDELSSKLIDSLKTAGTDILSSHNWQGVKVYDASGNDLTTENMNFISYAKFDSASNRYEFFDTKTGATKGDEGYYFVTQDDKKRVTASITKKYSAVVDLAQIDKDKFTYERMGKDANGNDVKVFVEHVPYSGDLTFTNQLKPLTKKTGNIETNGVGRDILGSTLWQGHVVYDEKGNDVTAYNQNFISIAKFDLTTNKYEFFDTTTGKSKGDFGFYDVIRDNKMRFTVSVGKKYFAPLELTELNNNKFTYTRTGKDSSGNDIQVTVEHIPYKGDLKVSFSN